MNYKVTVNNLFWCNCLLLAGFLWLTACSTTKHLQEKEAFVKQNTVKIVNAENVPKAKKLQEDLANIILQKPNTNFFGINRRWFYYQKLKKGKLNKNRKAGDRHIYEEPVIYDEELANRTTKSMEKFLYNQAYFHPDVTYKTEIKGDYTYTTYHVNPGKLFTIDTVEFISSDTAIQLLLNELSGQTVLQKGRPASLKLYEEEKRRITTTLKNKGYKEFYINYIDQLEAKVDTTTISKIPISLTVFPRSDGQPHQIYRVGKITIYPFHNPNKPVKTYQDTLIEGVLFRYPPAEEFPIKPEVILKRIALKTDSVYSQEVFNRTVRNLGSLGIFKFANVKVPPQQDSITQIDFDIYLPSNKKIVLGADIEVRNTFSSANSPTATAGNFLGGALNFSYRNRNLLRGSENFKFNFQIGGEFGSTAENNAQIFRTFDVSPRFELNIPKFRDPLHLARLFHSVGFFSNAFYSSLLENATTRITLGLSWSERRDFWGFFSGDLALGYSISNNPNRQYYLNQLGINFFDPSIGPDAEDVFETNPFLERSFNNIQLFTGLLFRDFGFTFTDRIRRNNDTWLLNYNMEVSGLEVAAVNGIYNLFRSQANDVTFQLFDLDFSKFARFEIDAVYYKYLTARQSLAFRLNSGIAFAYGGSSDVPYVKQFFAGGPTSVRGWRIRELGPGGYQEPSTFPSFGVNTTPFYQTGDFKFIFSVEYRFNLFKVYALDLEGALFVDGGNVWILREDPARPNAELDGDFLRQIALGTGVGFRMDFDYFKLALDLGYRIRNPFPNPEGSYWAYQRWRELGLRGINYNLSVGYPF